MEKIKFALVISSILLLSSCAETSAPEDLSGRLDYSKPVEYVLIEPEEKDKVLYVLDGRVPDPDESENTETSEDEVEEGVENIEEETSEEVEEEDGV